MTVTTFSAPPPADKAWGRVEVASYLDICVRSLTDLRREDSTFPRPRMVGRRPRWAPSTVIRWLEGSDDAATKAPARKARRVR